MSTVLGEIILPDISVGEVLQDDGTFASAVPSTVFTQYTDATTIGTFPEALYTDSLPANLLRYDGDVLEVTYYGTYENNANTKYAYITFNNMIISSNVVHTGANVGWQVTASIMRTSSSTARVTGVYTDGSGDIVTKYTDLTSIDYTMSIPVKLTGSTPDNAGDMTAKAGYAIRFK